MTPIISKNISSCLNVNGVFNHVAELFCEQPVVLNGLKSAEELTKLLTRWEITIAALLKCLKQLQCNDACNLLSEWVIRRYPTGFTEEYLPADTAARTPVQEEGALSLPIPESTKVSQKTQLF